MSNQDLWGIAFLVIIALCFFNLVYATEKNRNPALWVMLTVFFGPLATLALACIPPEPKEETEQ